MADTVKLQTDPDVIQLVQDRLDAARYRWLREHYEVSASRHGVNDLLVIQSPTASSAKIVDAFMDAAMAKESGNDFSFR